MFYVIYKITTKQKPKVDSQQAKKGEKRIPPQNQSIYTAVKDRRKKRNNRNTKQPENNQ